MLVNLEINREKNRQCISITNHNTSKNNHISNGLCSYALVCSYYRSSQLFRHTSLLTLAAERTAWVLLTISPDFEKIRSQKTVVAGVKQESHRRRVAGNAA